MWHQVGLVRQSVRIPFLGLLSVLVLALRLKDPLDYPQQAAWLQLVAGTEVNMTSKDHKWALDIIAIELKHSA